MRSVVLGLGYGDEGKGMVTDWLCSSKERKVVIRFSGGHQAGHTVQIDGVRHVHSNFGSGALRGIPTYWSSHCTIDPIGIVNELKVLLEKGVRPSLYINDRCPITTPYDKAQNQFLAQGDLHNSCGVGFGTTLQREKDHYKLNAFDLNYPDILKQKVNLIGEKYYKFNSNSLQEFYDAVQYIKDYSDIQIVSDVFAAGHFTHEIYEGSQGILLDKDVGFFPYVTRSNTGITNLLAMTTETLISLRLQETSDINFYFVTRAYSTRHGNGPFKKRDKIVIDADQETNVDNKFQGDFKVAPLDMNLLSYGLNKMMANLSTYKRESWRFNLVITCMDHMTSFKLVKNNAITKYPNRKEFIEAIRSSFNYKFLNVYTNDSSEGKLNLVV